MIRRRFLLAAGVLAVPQGAIAANGELSDLKWTGKAPTFPLFRAVASGDFRGEVEARITTKSEPIRYRKYLAYYRLAEALGSKLVPRTGVLAVRLPQLLLALRGDPEGLSLLREDMAVLNDGTVLVMVSEPIVDGHEIDFSAGPEVKSWRMSAESRASVPPERSSLVAGYVEALVLDYLAAETRRSVAVLSNDSKVLHLTENGSAFGERPDPQGLDIILDQLKRVTRFPRAFVQRLRAFDRARAERALHAGPFLAWLVSSRPISEMMERREAVLESHGCPNRRARGGRSAGVSVSCVN